MSQTNQRVTNPQVSRMLTIALDHISESTQTLLENDPETNAVGYLTGISVYDKGEYGYFIYLPRKPELKFPEATPNDLKTVLQYCHDMNCDILCLDVDGNQIPYLKWYGDEE